MARLNFSLRMLLLVSITSLLSTTQAIDCYQPNGSLQTSDTPCNTDGSASTCCAEGWVCLSDGVCQLTEEVQGQNETFYYRGTCTDQSWEDPGCLNICRDGSEFVTGTNDNASLALVKCSRADGEDYYCCTNDPTCSCETQEGAIYSLGSTQPFTVTYVGYTTWANSVNSVPPTTTSRITAPDPATTGSKSATRTGTKSQTASATSTSSNAATAAAQTSSSSSGSGSGAAVSSTPRQQRHHTGLAIGLGVGLGLAAALLLFFLVFLYYRRRKHSHAPLAQSPPNDYQTPMSQNSTTAPPYGQQSPYGEPTAYGAASDPAKKFYSDQHHVGELPADSNAQRYEADSGVPTRHENGGAVELP